MKQTEGYGCKRVVIVGHGPSMLEKTLGAFIDECDVVVRQKRCSKTLKFPLQYGTHTNYVIGSWNVIQTLPLDMPGCLYWAFLDSRNTDGVSFKDIRMVEEGVPCVIRKQLCDYWNREYREARKPITLDPRQVVVMTTPEPRELKNELGHPHMSAGMHALVYAAQLLRPEEIYLAGYDNIQTGSFTWSVTRGAEWNRYPDHNWATEHEMVPKIAEFYGVKIEYV